MTRVLFEHITNYLHFNNDSKMVALGEETFDKLLKIRPPMTHLQSQFRDILTFPMERGIFCLKQFEQTVHLAAGCFQTQV